MARTVAITMIIITLTYLNMHTHFIIAVTISIAIELSTPQLQMWEYGLVSVPKHMHKYPCANQDVVKVTLRYSGDAYLTMRLYNRQQNLLALEPNELTYYNWNRDSLEMHYTCRYDGYYHVRVAAQQLNGNVSYAIAFTNINGNISYGYNGNIQMGVLQNVSALSINNQNLTQCYLNIAFSNLAPIASVHIYLYNPGQQLVSDLLADAKDDVQMHVNLSTQGNWTIIFNTSSHTISTQIIQLNYSIYYQKLSYIDTSSNLCTVTCPQSATYDHDYFQCTSLASNKALIFGISFSVLGAVILVAGGTLYWWCQKRKRAMAPVNPKPQIISESHINNPYANSYCESPETIFKQNNSRIECTICLDSKCDFKVVCGHLFHKKCISQWSTKNGQCPVCRKKITT